MNQFSLLYYQMFFALDVTRSGYFMNTGPSDVVEDPGDEVQSGPKQGASVNHSSTNSSSSSFEYSCNEVYRADDMDIEEEVHSCACRGGG